MKTQRPPRHASRLPLALPFALLAAAALAVPVGGHAAPALRKQMLLNGDFQLFGNALAHDCAAGVTPTVGTVGACGSASTTDSGVDIFWRSNYPTAGAASADVAYTAAQAQSTAVLSIPAGATVKYARLYWAAAQASNAYDTAATLVTPDAVSHAITADRGWTITDTFPTPDQYWYQSSADITAIVQALAEPRGAYTLSGADSRDFRNSSFETIFAAWYVVVFYEDLADINLRQLTLFDGLDYVRDGVQANATLGGFLVPSGGFDAKLGVVTFEGDYSATGDQLLFKGYKSTGPAPSTLTTLSDAQNPATNFFNGTRSWLGAARTVAGDLPQYSGGAASMQSFDLDVVDLKALGAIASGDDSASIRATSTGDVFALGAFITSVTTLKPGFPATVKRAVNLTRATGAFAGDVIEYTIDTQNTGNDPSVQTTLTDRLPPGVTFVPGSLEIVLGANAGVKTDAAGDDQAEYDAATRTVTFRLGTGATWDPTAYPGGVMAIGETATIRFQVTIDVGASGTLQNLATIVAAGLNGEPAHPFDSNPPIGAGTTDVPVDPCLSDAHCGGTTPACWTTPTPNLCVGCTDDSYCAGSATTPYCDTTVYRCAGPATLAPAAQEAWTVAGTAAPFTLTLTNHLAAADTFALAVTDSGCGWSRTFPASIALASGASSTFTLQPTPPGGTAIGTACTFTVTATAAGSPTMQPATANATLTVGAGATFTPDYTGTATKIVPSGGDVGFPGVVQNNGAASLDFALAASVSASAGTPSNPVFYSDPNGDGDWSDGAIITSTGSIPPFGGQAHVVLVQRATTTGGVALAYGTTLTLTATATNGATVATQSSAARVQYAATYSDDAFAVSASHFAPCQTVYLRAELLPTGFPFALEWYAKASPVRGTDTPVRSVSPWSVSGGMGNDQFTLPATASGTWTVLVVRQTTPTATVIDTITFTAERLGSFLSLTVTPTVGSGEGIAVQAQVRNENLFAPYASSQLAYVVTDQLGTIYMDPTGLFGSTPTVAHTTSSLDVLAGATGSDSWASPSQAWPAAGNYRVDAEWRLACGATPTIATATAGFQVVPTGPRISVPADGSYIRTQTPTFSGYAIPGGTVTITVGSSTCGPVTTSAGGTWSCPLATPLAEGAHSATATQTVNSVTSAPGIPSDFVVDTLPPTLTLTAPSNGALLGAADAPAGVVTFTGATESGASVSVNVDGTARAATVVGTTWTLAVTLADGSHAATATASDAAGNAATASTSFTLDRTPPAAPIVTYPVDGALLDAVDAPAGFLTLTGTAETGAVVRVTIGATTVVATRSGSGWSASFTLADGAYTATATATDAAGNGSGTTSVGFAIDTNPPNPPAITSPTAGATLNGVAAPGGAVTLTGTTETGARVDVTLDGTTYAATVVGTDWSLTRTLADGAHALSAVATDAAGNGSLPTTLLFSTDVTPPALAFVSPAAGSTIGSGVAPSGSVTFAGTTEAGATVVVTVDGTPHAATVGGTTWSVTVSLADGPHSATAVATDAAGNASAGAPHAFTLDTVPPTVAIASPTAGATLNAAAAPGGVVSITGSVESGASVTVTVDGVPRSATVVGGSWSLSATLADGPHTATAVATDAAGNTASATRSFSLDTIPPPVAIAAPANGATLNGVAAPGGSVTFSGTTEAGASVTVTVGGVPHVATVTGTAWSVAVTLADGAPSATATAADAAGNTASATTSFLLDTVALAPTLATPGAGAGVSTHVAFTGAAEPLAAVTVVEGVVSLCATAADASGNWSCAATLTLGAHSVTATQVDAAGNASPASAPRAFTVLDYPVVILTAPGPVNGANATAYPVGGSCDAAAGTVSISVGSVTGSASCIGGLFSGSLNVSALPDGSSIAVGASQTNATGTGTDSRTTWKDTAVAPPAFTAPAAGASVAVSPTVSGTGEAGATVTVVEGATTVCTAIVAAGGAWSCSTSLGLGSHSLVATQVDAAGNASTASPTRTFDVVAAPTVGLGPLATIAAANVAAWPVTGTCTSGGGASDVTVEVGFVTATVPCTAGTFSASLDLRAVADGLALLVTASQSSPGGTGTASAAVAKDTVAAAPVFVSPAAGAAVAPLPTLAGTAEPLAIVTVKEGSTTLCLATASTFGDWSCASSLGIGPHSLTAVQVDAAGNTSPAATRTFTVADLPVVTLDPVAVVNAAATVAFPVRGGCTSSAGDVTVSVGAVTRSVPCTLGAWSTTLDLSTLPEGPGLQVVASQTNSSGTGSAVRTTAKDTVANPPLVASPGDGATVAPSPTLTGTAEPFAVVTVKEGIATLCAPTADGTGAWSCPTTLGLGPHTLVATQLDPAGNASAAASRSFSVAGVPAISLNPLPPIALSNHGAYAVVGACDATAGSVTVAVGTVTAVVPCTGTFAATLDVSTVPDAGAVAVVASQSNGTGTGSASRVVLKDTVATAPSFASPVAGALVAPAPTAAGTAEPGATVAVTDDTGAAACTAVADPLGRWSCPTSLSVGAHTLTAVSTDLAGNVSPPATVGFVVAGVPVVALAPPAPIRAANAGAFPVSGRCDPSAGTVTVRVGTSSTTTTCSAGGTFSVAVDASALPDGSAITVSAEQANATGTGSDSRTTSKDTVVLPPVVATPTEGQHLATRTPTFSGTAEPGALVVITTAAGAELARATADGTGAWSVASAVALADGLHDVRVTQQDPAGNPSAPASRSFVVVAAPTLESPAAGAVLDADRPVVLAGQALPGETVAVWLDGAKVGDATADGTGRWSLTLPAGTISEGAHAATATARGESSAPTPFSVRLPEVRLSGGGCGCSGAGGGGGASALVGLLLALALRARPRRGATR